MSRRPATFLTRILGPRFRVESRFVPNGRVKEHQVQGWRVVDPVEVRYSRNGRFGCEWLLDRAYRPWWWRVVDFVRGKR